MVSIRLLPGQRQIQAELSENTVEGTYNNYELAENKCWHHVAFVRRLNESILYYNGEPVSSEFAGLQLDVNNDGRKDLVFENGFGNYEIHLQLKDGTYKKLDDYFQDEQKRTERTYESMIDKNKPSSKGE